MTTMTNFSATAERIGKTTSEKRAVEAMANALGSVENAIADGDTRYDGRCFIDDVEQYASEGLDSLDKRTLNHISDERISELIHEVALTFDYLEEYDEPATSPEANNDKENAMTAPQTSVFIPSSAASMSFEDFIDGMYLFASKWVAVLPLTVWLSALSLSTTTSRSARWCSSIVRLCSLVMTARSACSARW